MDGYYFLIEKNRTPADLFIVKGGKINSYQKSFGQPLFLETLDSSDLLKIIYEHWVPLYMNFGEEKIYSLEKAQIPHWSYYPRIDRPVFPKMGIPLYSSSWVLKPPIDYHAWMSSLNQLSTLVDRLIVISKTLQLDAANFKAFGNEIRNLIILACTEVETQMKGVLLANDYPGKPQSFNTMDYVKLVDPMKLKSYSVALKHYPWLGPFSPFKDWDSNKPSQSLTWYQAYNAIKHDRENNFKMATLEHAIHSIIAAAIILLAQYGDRPAWQEQLGHFFVFDRIPTWDSLDYYIDPEGGEEWVPIPANI